MVVKFHEIFDAFEFVSFGAMDEHEAYLCIDTGKIYYHSEYGDDEALPDDIDDDQYIAIPHKNELDLGKKLILDFAYQFTPDEVAKVEAIFSRQGAYSRFKDFLEHRALLDQWYEFESEASKNAVKAWCQLNSIDFQDEREWIIQRCVNAFKNDYEDWPGYCERLITRDEMRQALKECGQKWPEHEFRGHNVVNQKPGSDQLREIQ